MNGEERDRSMGNITVRLTRSVYGDLEEERQATNLFELGHNLLTQFATSGVVTDLEESIENLQNAVELTDDIHPSKPTRLFYLGLSQQTRFYRHGDLIDIEHSILNLRRAVQFTDGGHPD